MKEALFIFEEKLKLMRKDLIMKLKGINLNIDIIVVCLAVLPLVIMLYFTIKRVNNVTEASIMQTEIMKEQQKIIDQHTYLLEKQTRILRLINNYSIHARKGRK